MGLRIDHFHHFDPVKIDVVHHHTDAAEDPRLDQILTLLQNNSTVLQEVKGDLSTIMATEQELLDQMAKVDTATTKMAGNVQVIADITTQNGTVLSTISDEVDVLLTELKDSGVSQSTLDKMSALGAKADAGATASDTAVTALQSLIPVLQGIATKASNAVPVQPPPPPPAPPLPTA